MHAFATFSLTLLALAGWAGAARAAAAEYRVTVVGPPNSRPADINNAGVVIGNIPTGQITTRAFINHGKGVVYLNPLCSQTCDAQAINDRGVVLGNWTTPSGQTHGFLYYHGRQRDIGTLGGRPALFVDINNAGYMVAVSADTTFEATRSFLRAPNGKVTDLGTLPTETPITFARALNNRNQVTGASGPGIAPDPPLRAFLWTRGRMRDLGDLGFVPNEGAAINDRGQVAGSAGLLFGFRNQAAFLYSKGRLMKLDPRPDNVDQFTTAVGINIHGHVVGSSDRLGAYVYRGRKMESLNALIDPKSGWTIQFPRAINDKGQIAASGSRGGAGYAVRLDLIRPHHLGTPPAELDEEAAAADGKAPAEAQAREETRPPQQ